jgi:hypothetical protein
MDLKIKILKEKSDNLMVSLPYNPQFVQRIKTIKEHRWHSDSKYWTTCYCGGGRINLALK